MDNLSVPFTVFMLEILRFIGGLGLLFRDVVRELFGGKFYWKLVVEQIYQIGMRSMPLILITSVSIGMVMSLQFGLGLEKFGGKLYVPKLLAVTILREMGPRLHQLDVSSPRGSWYCQ